MEKNRKSIQILRGSTSKGSSVTNTELLDGQLFYDRSTNTLKIGSTSKNTVSTADTITVANDSITNDKLNITTTSVDAGTTGYVKSISLANDGTLTVGTGGMASSSSNGLLSSTDYKKLQTLTLSDSTLTLDSSYSLSGTLAKDTKLVGTSGASTLSSLLSSTNTNYVANADYATSADSATNATNVSITNNDTGSNAKVDFSIGTGTYSKTINNVNLAQYAYHLGFNQVGNDYQPIYLANGGGATVCSKIKLYRHAITLIYTSASSSSIKAWIHLIIISQDSSEYTFSTLMSWLESSAFTGDTSASVYANSYPASGVYQNSALYPIMGIMHYTRYTDPCITTLSFDSGSYNEYLIEMRSTNTTLSDECVRFFGVTS